MEGWVHGELKRQSSLRVTTSSDDVIMEQAFINRGCEIIHLLGTVDGSGIQKKRSDNLMI